MADKPLTVGFHETPLLTKLNQENQFGFWFQLNDEQREQIGSPWGPSNPQSLNRYSYVLNNPLKYTDPSGHVSLTKEKARQLDITLYQAQQQLKDAVFRENATLLAGGLFGIGVAGILASAWALGTGAAIGGATIEAVAGLAPVFTDPNGTRNALDTVNFMREQIDMFLRDAPEGATITFSMTTRTTERWTQEYYLNASWGGNTFSQRVSYKAYQALSESVNSP